MAENIYQYKLRADTAVRISFNVRKCYKSYLKVHSLSASKKILGISLNPSVETSEKYIPLSNTHFLLGCEYDSVGTK